MEEDFKKIQPITDWESKKSVASSFVELFNVVEKLKALISKYKSISKHPTGSDIITVDFENFDINFRSSFPVVNSLKENWQLDDVVSELKVGRQVLIDFIRENEIRFLGSTIQKIEITGVFSAVKKLIGSLSITIRRIEEVARYQ